MSTSSVKQVITNTIPTSNQLISTGINKTKYQLISTDTSKARKRKFDNDYLFESLSELVNTQFKAWYCKHFYRLGKTKVMEIAALAKADGKEPKKLFSFLLKNA